MKISNSVAMISRPVGTHEGMLSRLPSMHQVVLSRQLKALASKGGKARAIKLTSDQRTEIAVKAANARWSKGEENNGTIRPQ